MPTNEYGQPIGEPIPDWSPRPRPIGTPVIGRHCRVERLHPARHLDQLWAVVADDEPSAWTYMFYGPFESKAAFQGWLEAACAQSDPYYYAIVDLATSTVKGFASYLRIEPNAGVIEVGSIYFSRALRRSVAATEAMYLMMRHAIEDMGYRRYEWKCDSLNAPSRRAAERLGFVFEGIFRQAVVYKGRNRDTAWFSIVDREWPEVKRALEHWLDPGNFNVDGSQKTPLADLRTHSEKNL